MKIEIAPRDDMQCCMCFETINAGEPIVRNRARVEMHPECAALPETAARQERPGRPGAQPIGAPGSSQHSRMPPATTDLGDQVVAALEGRRQSVPAPFVALPSAAGTPAPVADLGDQIVVQLMQRRGLAIPADLQHAVAAPSAPPAQAAIPPPWSVEWQLAQIDRVRQAAAAGDVGDQVVTVLERTRGSRVAAQR